MISKSYSAGSKGLERGESPSDSPFRRTSAAGRLITTNSLPVEDSENQATSPLEKISEGPKVHSTTDKAPAVSLIFWVKLPKLRTGLPASSWSER